MTRIISTLERWDISLFRAIFGWEKSRFISRCLPAVSRTADGFYYPPAILVLLLFSPRKGSLLALSSAAAFFLQVSVYMTSKRLFKRSRPFERLSGIRKRRTPADRFSFPSGHTGGAFIMATLLGYFFPPLFAPLFIWAMLVGVSRVYLGLHYPTDILAGIFIGTLSSFAGLFLFL